MTFRFQFGLVALVAMVAIMSTTGVTRAELSRDLHIGSGDGESIDNGDGSYTIYDTGEPDGDLWTSGDSFQYLYDATPWSGDFSATVRVLGQTETVDGRWGKAGIRATSDPTASDAAFAMVQVHTGNDSTGDDPRLAGRRVAGDLANMLEIGMIGNPPRGIVPQAGAEVMWLRLDRAGNDFSAFWAVDDNGSPAPWSLPTTTSELQLPETVTLGFGYSAHSSLPDGRHGVTFDRWRVVPEPASWSILGLGAVVLVRYARRTRRRRTMGVPSVAD